MKHDNNQYDNNFEKLLIRLENVLKIKYVVTVFEE